MKKYDTVGDAGKLAYAFAALATVAAAFAGPLAEAHSGQTVKTVFPGTICQPWGGSSNPKAHISYSVFGRVMNTHPTQKLTVVCPIVRDNPSSEFDLRVYWSDGYVGEGANNTGTLYCRIRSNNVWGDASTADTWRFDTHQAHGNQYGGWESGNFLFNDVNAHYHGNATLVCNLPPKQAGRSSSIGSIVTAETSE